MQGLWHAENIKALRTGRRQTQAKFAQNLLTDRNTIIRWERGTMVPNMENQKKLDALAAE